MSQAGSLTGSGGGGGNITITGDTGVPIVGNNFVFSGGTTGLTFDGFGIDQTIYVENFNLPDTTSSTQGALTIGGTPFIHAYGGVLDENTFIGIASGNFTLTPGVGNAQFNNGIGARTLLSLTTGFGNNCMGQGAGQAITSGSLNCLVGSGAGSSIQNGIANVFIGNGSGQTLTTGCNNNIGIGQQALVFLATGSRNIGIGYVNAGLAYTGAESDNILISNNGVVGESNKMRLGTSGAGAGQVNATYIAGISGTTVTGGQTVVVDSSSQLGNGIALNSAQPAFAAYPNAIIANVTGDGTIYNIVYNVELFDQNGDFNLGTSTFTAPVTGKYYFSFSTPVTGVGATHTFILSQLVTSSQIYTSNYMSPATPGGAGSAVNTFMSSASWCVSMTAGDTAFCRLLVAGGAKVVGLLGGVNETPSFSGFLVC